MAFSPNGLSNEELELHRDHSRLITGTVSATLMGHGYQEDTDISHMDGILRIYARMRGEASARTPMNKAMSVGIEMEPIAFQHFKRDLEQERIEGMSGLIAMDELVGLRLDDTDGVGLGFGANIDAPLVDITGEKEDPTTGKMLPMRDYARKWGRYEQSRQRLLQENVQRSMMGEPPLDVPENPLAEPPFAGVADLKTTMAYDVRLEVGAQGPYAGWIVQLHHYNAALKAKNEQNGYSTDDYTNALAIGHLYTGDMKTRTYQAPFDEALEAEIIRRGELFLDCVEKGISPDSPAVRHHFTPYPVKRVDPAAKLASDDLEQKLVKGFKKLDYCTEKADEWGKLKQETLEAIQALYEDEVSQEGQTVYANGREMVMASSSRASKSLNRDALNAVIDAAADARVATEKAMAALEAGDTHEAMSQLAQARVERLPEENVRSVDAYEDVTRTATKPRFAVKATKKAQKVYDQLMKSEGRWEGNEAKVKDLESNVPPALAGASEQPEQRPERNEQAPAGEAAGAAPEASNQKTSQAPSTAPSKSPVSAPLPFN